MKKKDVDKVLKAATAHHFGEIKSESRKLFNLATKVATVSAEGSPTF